jgi:ABC-2 type transport system permease protein
VSWYYAFQQVGDQTAEPQSLAYREGRTKRQTLSGRLAWLSPPARLELTLQQLSGTDAQSTYKYEDQVRAFHTQLRQFYYPKLFLDEPYSTEAASQRPEFANTSRPQ